MAQQTSRRRFLQISAACAGLGVLGPQRESTASPVPLSWRGVALSNLVSVSVVHPDHRRARKVLAAVRDEIRRLEMIFTLYDSHSTLTLLNRDGRVTEPPADLVRILSDARALGEATAGLFDVTVQPLWDIYAAHFFVPGADPAGPDGAAIQRATELVDFRQIEIDASEIRLPRPGMAITLNGIAQGYMTDRIADLLKNAGMSDVLVDLGEIRAGDSKSHEAWTAKIRSPLGDVAGEVPLLDQALATSGSYGFQFDAEGRFHHIYDPRNGRCPRRYASVSVIAPSATCADALATAFNLMPSDAIAATLRAAGGTRAILQYPDRRIASIEAASI